MSVPTDPRHNLGAVPDADQILSDAPLVQIGVTGPDPVGGHRPHRLAELERQRHAPVGRHGPVRLDLAAVNRGRGAGARHASIVPTTAWGLSGARAKPFEQGGGWREADAASGERRVSRGCAANPEAWDEALTTAVEGRSASRVASGQQVGDFSGGWRASANKLVVVVTDATAAGFDDEADDGDFARAQAAARTASSEDIRVTTIFVPNENAEPDAGPQLRQVAGTGGGAFFQTQPDGANLTDGLDLAVRTCGSDSDGDGLFDRWETEGIDFNGDGTVDVDLAAMGADPQHKDLFVQVNWMVPPEPTRCWHLVFCPPPPAGFSAPRAAAYQRFGEALKDAPVENPDGVAGITLHVDAGLSTPSQFGIGSAARIGGPLPRDNWSDPLLPDFRNVDYESDEADQVFAPVDTLHTVTVPAARQVAFTWVVYVPNIARPGSGQADGSVIGLARGLPSDIVMLDGTWMTSVSKEAANIMHEVGHTLALGHGGADDLNDKPNYLSVMNYSHSNRDGLVRGGHANVLDYSRYDLADLDETSLSETGGMTAATGAVPTDTESVRLCDATRAASTNGDPRKFGAAGPVDWNCDGDESDPSVSQVVHTAGDGSTETLTSQNDWLNLIWTGGVRGGLVSEPTPGPIQDTDLTEERHLATPKDFAVSLQGGGGFEAAPGSAGLTVTFDVTNIGTESDTYGFVADGPEGTSPRVVDQSVEIAAGGRVSVAVVFDVPADATAGDELTVEGTLTSESVPAVSAVGIASVTVGASEEPSADAPLGVSPASVLPGEVVTVDGDGFAAGTPVTVWGEPSVGEPVVAVAGPDGTVRAEVRVSDHQAPGAVTFRAAGNAPAADVPVGTAEPLATEPVPRGAPRGLDAEVEIRGDGQGGVDSGTVPWELVGVIGFAIVVLVGAMVMVFARRRQRATPGEGHPRGPDDGGGPSGGLPPVPGPMGDDDLQVELRDPSATTDEDADLGIRLH